MKIADVDDWRSAQSDLALAKITGYIYFAPRMAFEHKLGIAKKGNEPAADLARFADDRRL